MKRIAAILCIVLLTGCAVPLREAAHASTAADIGTTVLGISSGAGYEANPLASSPAGALALIGFRTWLIEYVNKFEEPARTEWLSRMNGIWWGVVINNALVVVSATTPVSVLSGIVGGWFVYKNALENGK